MSNKTFAQRAFAVTLGAVLALGTVPAFAYASESGPKSDGTNSAGPNQQVQNQEKDPGWFTNGVIDETEQGPTTHGYDANNPAADYESQNRVIKDEAGSGSNSGEVAGVQGDMDEYEVLKSASELWRKMYPNENVPDALFGRVSGGISFPEAEPKTDIDNAYDLDMMKRDFRDLVGQVYPGTDYPLWLFSSVSSR